MKCEESQHLDGRRPTTDVDYVAKVRELKATGLSQRKIATQLGITRMMVSWALTHDLTRISPAVARGLLEKGQKRCPLCKSIKLTQDFGPNPAQPDGLASHCSDCRTTLSAAAPKEGRREKYVKSKTDLRDKHLRRRFNISLETYNQMLATQNGVCAICGRTDKNKSLAVDHNHATGQVRSLLCSSCNAGIGLFKENLIVMAKAMEYLQHFECGS